MNTARLRSLLACAAALVACSASAEDTGDWLRPVDLVDAVPLLNDSGRAGYGRFLQVTLRPRAFALNMNGEWAWNAGSDAERDAIAACEAHGLPCQLYAVDEEVVLPGFELGAPLRALGSRLVQGSLP